MGAGGPLAFTDVPSPPLPAQQRVSAGGELFSFKGQPFWLDTAGLLWALTGAGSVVPWAQGGTWVAATSTQGGTPGSPALTQQWQFTAANTTNANGSGSFGSVFWPGTFGSPPVTETSWDFGYNSPNLPGYSSSKPQAYHSILPDCGDTHGVEIETKFVSPDGQAIFPYQFVGTTDGTDTGNWLFTLPKGDGTYTFGVKHPTGGTVDAYLAMSGLAAATAAAPGVAGFGSTALPVTVSVSGALLAGQRMAMSGTAGVSNSLSLTFGGASAPASVPVQIFLEPITGQPAIVGFGQAGTDQWRLGINGSDGIFRITDQANSGTARMAFTPGASPTASKITVNAIMQFFTSLVMGTGALATNATSGFLYLPSCAGAPTGTPATQSGTCAVIYDTTDNQLWIYNGAWKAATFA
jgi:hypothetical protein